jgi:cellulose synthase/poly-beta-1,6-N-acetylglucosamine synthase-like glycosyltransferase
MSPAKEDCRTVVMENSLNHSLHSAGESVNQSLSIVLPVHNAEQSLAHDVHLLLDLLPDLTNQFEILIVDDGSDDHSDEIAHELALEYPQVRVMRHHTRQGQAATMQAAVTKTTGEIVLVQEEGTEIRPKEIRRLWDLRHDQELVMARTEVPRRTVSAHLLDRLAHWGDQLRATPPVAPPGGIQMIRREAVEELERLKPGQREAVICQMSGPKFLTRESSSLAPDLEVG